jgi:hypothetical protein
MEVKTIKAKRYVTMGLVLAAVTGIFAGYYIALASPQKRAYPYKMREFWVREQITEDSFQMFDWPYALVISEYVFVEGDQEGGGTFTALLNLEEGTGFGESLNEVSMDGLQGAFRGVTFMTLTGEDSAKGEFVSEGSGDFEGWFMKGTLSKQGYEVELEGVLLIPIS